MNKGLLVVFLLIVGVLGIALVQRAAFSSGKQVRRVYLSEDLKIFQGEWYASLSDGDLAYTAFFKGRSLRLVGGTQWRKTHTLVGLDNSAEKKRIVVDGGADALVYRFDSDDVLWLEFEPDTQSARTAIRFERVNHSD